MKVVEILILSRKILESLQKSCINISDIRYLAMYEEYRQIINNKQKVSFAAALLSQKYHISERQFYYIIKRFEADCKITASE